jgi:hypothetical protein
MGETVEEAMVRIKAIIESTVEPFISDGTVFDAHALDHLVGQSFPVHVRREVDGVPNTIVGTFGTGTITGVEVDPDGKTVSAMMNVVPDGNISIELSFLKDSLSFVED